MGQSCAVEHIITLSGDTLVLPWNTQQMTDEDVVELIRSINNRKIKLMLELRDENNNLIGFKRIKSLEEIECLNYKKCEYFENLNVDNDTLQLPFNAKMIEYKDGEFLDVVIDDGTLKAPFNAKQMTESQMMSFIKKINNGKIRLALEVRNNKGELVGFQSMLSVDELDNLIEECSNYSRYLLCKVKKASIFSKKRAREEFEEFKKAYHTINSIKTYMIDNPIELEYEFKLIKPYPAEDIQLSNDFKEIQFSRR